MDTEALLGLTIVIAAAAVVVWLTVHYGGGQRG